ncbi:hypothetical protein [Streptomyces cinereoruber]|uniref:hypothetical protein n=1 Tax=Streptomyces cinereoruber TaxID=67260 RepID=UPI003633A0FA
MRRGQDGHTTYDESTDESQGVELDGPDLAGFYTSQLHDWIPLSPYLSDSAVRLYWIMRALVIEKHGPVRKLTLLQLAYMLPRKPVAAGEKAEPSGLGRIRDLMRMLTRERLLTTPEGEEIKTSSRASAASRPLRIRIHDRPAPGYDGPRNAFALLDAVRGPAAEAARQAIAREAEREAQKRAQKAAKTPGWISNPVLPTDGAGWISNPGGWKSNPGGWKFNPGSGADLQDRVPPLSPPAQSPRSHPDLASVRPSVQVVDVHVKTTDGGTDGGGGDIEDQEHGPVRAGGGPAAADAAPEKNGSNEGGGAGTGPSSALRPVDLTPGVEVLRAIAAEAPDWTITHAASLRDQGRTVTGMLESGYTPQDIRHAILARELPRPLRTTVAGVISGRLRDLIAVGPSAGIQPIPAQQTGTYGPARRETAHQDDAPTPTPAAWSDQRVRLEDEVAGRGRSRPCAAGDGMVCPHDALPGHDLCASCLGGERPTCAGCGRFVVAPGLLCIVCSEPPAAVEMGDCPGHGGTPCGRAVVTEGLCRRCKIAAERDRAAAEAEFEAARDAAIAAVKAAEAAPAPL